MSTTLTRRMQELLRPIDPSDPNAPQRAVAALRETCNVVLRMPAIYSAEHNERGQRAAHRFFARLKEERYRGVYPEVHRQKGLTERGRETTRQRPDRFRHLPRLHQPHFAGSRGSVSERLMFGGYGKPPPDLPERFRSINQQLDIPSEVQPFAEDLFFTGNALLSAAMVLDELLELGLGLPRGTLTALCQGGPHILGPNATIIDEDVVVGDVANDPHYDFNMYTIFGKANAPGLFVLVGNIENGSARRMQLGVPEGCILIQAGRQLEYLTGGYIKCGIHEVMVTHDMIRTLKEQTRSGRLTRPIRTSLPMFRHVRSTAELKPLDGMERWHGGTAGMDAARQKYPGILAGDLTLDELTAINLTA